MRGFRERSQQLWRKATSMVHRDHSRPENDQERSKTTRNTAVSTIKPNNKLRTVAMSAATAILITGTVYLAGQQYVKANTVPYYRVFVGGQEIGTIASESQLLALYKSKEQEYKEKYPEVEMAVHTEGITTQLEKAYKANIDSKKTLEELDGMLTGYAKGVELRVDGKSIGIVKDEATAQAVLQQVKQKFIPKSAGNDEPKVKLLGGAKKATSVKVNGAAVTVESAKFSEEVTNAPVKADPNKVMDANEALQRILEGDEEAIIYAVREGDSISSIAKRYGITQKELISKNPDIEELSLQIGTELNIKAVQPALTVQTVERVSEEIITEPEVIIRKNDNMPAGQSKVIAQGASGLKKMEYRLTKENGEVVHEEWLGQEVIKASTPKIIVKGTKVVLGEGSGQFSWPVLAAKMTSSYGERWGRTHKGIDIVSSNKSILASDDGVVTFAGKKTGYGNVIIINHKNGYETLYGHLSKISVKEGQVVEKGSKIGVMGNTGRSTGTHLHFEIHKNGSINNPMKYL